MCLKCIRDIEQDKNDALELLAVVRMQDTPIAVKTKKTIIAYLKALDAHEVRLKSSMN